MRPGLAGPTALFARRELRRRPGRALLTGLGIAIGVAAVVAVGITVESSRNAYGELFATLGGRAALEIVAPGLEGIDPAPAADAALADPAVADAVPLVRSTAALRAGGRTHPVTLLGIDPGRDAVVRRLDLAAGDGLAARDGLLLERGFAARAGLALGDRPALAGPGGTVEVELVGLLEPTGAAGLAGGGLAVLRIGRARELLALGYRVTAVQLVLEEDADAGEAAARLRSRLPSPLEVREPAERGIVAEDSLLATRRALESMSGISLVAGAFVILNAFLMSLAERRRQIAILRAIGATRRQVVAIFLGQAVFLGIAGTAAGIGAGIAAAWVLARGLEMLLVTTLPPLVIGAGPLVAAAILGPGVSLAASFVPARRAAALDPLTGLLDDRARESERPPRAPLVAGLVLVAVAVASVPLFLHAPWFPAEAANPLIAVFLVGAVLSLPLLFPPLFRLVMPLLARLFPVAGTMAFRSLARDRGRTAFTAGVLFIAFVISVSTGTVLLSSVRDLDEWYERAVPGDLFVRATFPDTGIMAAAAMPASTGADLAALPGAADVDAIAFVPTRANGRPCLLIAYEFDGGALPLDLEEGGREAVAAGLAAGGAVLGTRLADELRAGPGDVVELAGATGPARVPVVGITTEYTGGGSVVVLGRETALRLYPGLPIHAFVIEAERGAAASLEAEVAEFSAARGLLYQTRSGLRETIDTMTEGIVAFLWLLMALMFVVASLGTANTLTMNVLEQTRTLGILRAVAMTKRQVARTVVAQATGLLVLGVLPGLPVGMVTAWFMTMISRPLIGLPLDFAVDPRLLAVTVAGATAVTLLAALLPARRAARLDVVTALSYE